MKKTFIALAVCASITLTGCSLIFPDIETPRKPEDDCSEALSQKEYDDCLAVVAQKENDTSYCDRIKPENEIAKIDCYTNLAVKNKDSNICHELDGFAKDDCLQKTGELVMEDIKVVEPVVVEEEALGSITPGTEKAEDTGPPINAAEAFAASLCLAADPEFQRLAFSMDLGSDGSEETEAEKMQRELFESYGYSNHEDLLSDITNYWGNANFSKQVVQHLTANCLHYIEGKEKDFEAFLLGPMPEDL